MAVVPNGMAGASLLGFPSKSHCRKGYLLFARDLRDWNSNPWASGANCQVSLLSMTLELLTVFFWELMKASLPPNHSESFVLYIQKSLVLLT